MALITGQVACPSNAATLIVAAANANANASGSAQASRSVVLRNPSAQDVYLGGSSVTTATGFLLASGSTVTFTLGVSEVLYGRGAQFTPVVHYMAS